MCWQSRARLLTGMTVSVHQFFKINSQAFYGKVVQLVNTLFSLLKRKEHHVGYVGKCHAPLPTPAKSMQAFDMFREYHGAHWVERDGELWHVTELNQANALEFLQNRLVDQAFALTVSFYATHSWNAMTLSGYENLGRSNWRSNGFAVEEHRQVTMKRKYRMATEVDDTIGAIIAELKEQGVYDNTLIIFTSDNGYYDGDFGLPGKWYTHDQSIRVPLLNRDPRMPLEQRGLVNDNIALNVDLAPTILVAAGVEPPEAMQGRDLAQLYLTPEEDLASLE